MKRIFMRLQIGLALLVSFVGCVKSQTYFSGIVTGNTTTYSTLHTLFQPTTGNLILDHATVGWDKNQDLESTFFYDSSTSNVKIFFTGSSDSTNPAFYNQIGLATSTDMATFTKSASNPLIGMGHGGAPSGRRAHSSWIGKSGNTYYAFCLNGYGYNYTGEDRNVYLYTSPDGITWSDAGLIFNKTSIANCAGFGNTAIVVDANNTPVVVGGKYIANVEYRNTASGQWEMYRATASALTGPWTFTDHLTTLQVSSNTAYGGPCTIYSNGRYHCFYHYATTSNGVPTYLAYANSTDGITWTIREAPFMQIEYSPYGNTDQIADPYLSVVNGKVYMSAEYVQNSPSYFAQIRLWSYNGTFDQMISATGY